MVMSVNGLPQVNIRGKIRVMICPVNGSESINCTLLACYSIYCNVPIYIG